MKETYFVSGYMRSGTSMMMKALEAGGLDAAYNKARDERMNTKYGDDDYQPNGGGFYELGRNEYQAQDFPKKYEGQLVKCLYGGITKLVPGKYKIVFMRRDMEEIRQSHDAFFGNQPRQSVERIKNMLDEKVRILREREDVDVHEVWYRDVVDNPVREFTKLKECGFPIDVQEASKIVDPELCRFRLEKLEIGV